MKELSLKRSKNAKTYAVGSFTVFQQRKWYLVAILWLHTCDIDMWKFWWQNISCCLAISSQSKDSNPLIMASFRFVILWWELKSTIIYLYLFARVATCHMLPEVYWNYRWQLATYINHVSGVYEVLFCDEKLWQVLRKGKKEQYIQP